MSPGLRDDLKANVCLPDERTTTPEGGVALQPHVAHTHRDQWYRPQNAVHEVCRAGAFRDTRTNH